MKRNSFFINGLLLVALTGVMVGCADVEPTYHTSARREKMDPFKPSAEAGVKVDPSAYDLKKRGDELVLSTRPDPFALRSAEQAFDRSQRAANLVASFGGYDRMMYEEPEPADEADGLAPVEPQPERRLAGILIGDTITALIDMGDGSGIQAVRPGQIIEPAKEWQVASIDEEKLILRRTNKRTRPEVVVVRLGPGTASGPSSNPGQNQGAVFRVVFPVVPRTPWSRRR